MRLLVMNCHEPWIYQLRVLDADLDIVIGLPGRYTTTWDTAMRPLPPRSRLLTLAQVHAAPAGTWDCVIAHNITDLLDLKQVDAPALLMIHDFLEGRLAQQGSDLPPTAMREKLSQYLKIRGAHAVPISPTKAVSWGVGGDAVPNFVDPADYPAARFTKAAGLRVANHIWSKRVFLQWELHEAAFSGLPISIVGHNPELGATAAASWDALRDELATHRFFIHTANPKYEDGYNMASLEAMAAGLPILGNRHNTSPIKHGVSGFLSNDPDALRGFAERLLADVELARRMGEAARAVVAQRFTPARFRIGLGAAIQVARRKHARLTRAQGQASAGGTPAGATR
jgi:hypothetical protein